MTSIAERVAVLLLVLVAGCASRPPRGAVDEATKALTANPQVEAIFGPGYKATYREDRSLQSSSVGTRLQFDLLGDKGSGTADFQFGLQPDSGPWVADKFDVTYHQHTTVKRADGKWQAETPK